MPRFRDGRLIPPPHHTKHPLPFWATPSFNAGCGPFCLQPSPTGIYGHDTTKRAIRRNADCPSLIFLGGFQEFTMNLSCFILVTFCRFLWIILRITFRFPYPFIGFSDRKILESEALFQDVHPPCHTDIDNRLLVTQHSIRVGIIAPTVTILGMKPKIVVLQWEVFHPGSKT